MAEVNLAKSLQLIGEDRLVELRLLQPGVAIGLWKVKAIHHRCRLQCLGWILKFFLLRAGQALRCFRHVHPSLPQVGGKERPGICSLVGCG